MEMITRPKVLVVASGEKHDALAHILISFEIDHPSLLELTTFGTLDKSGSKSRYIGAIVDLENQEISASRYAKLLGLISSEGCVVLLNDHTTDGRAVFLAAQNNSSHDVFLRDWPKDAAAFVEIIDLIVGPRGTEEWAGA